MAADATRFAYLVGAGQDYAQDGELTKAQVQFRAAIEIDPSDPVPGRGHGHDAAGDVPGQAPVRQRRGQEG